MEPVKNDWSIVLVLSKKHLFNISFKAGMSISQLATNANENILHHAASTKNRENFTFSIKQSDSERGVLNDKNVVYIANCLDCKASGVKSQYVGETSRSLRIRVSEHMRKINNTDNFSASVISVHSLQNHGQQPLLE